MSRGRRALLVLLLALAGAAAGGRVLDAARARDPVERLRRPGNPHDVLRGLIDGGPGIPGWQDAAAPYAVQPELRALILLALAREGELESRTRAWLELTARGGDGARADALFARLAALALERH